MSLFYFKSIIYYFFCRTIERRCDIFFDFIKSCFQNGLTWVQFGLFFEKIFRFIKIENFIYQTLSVLQSDDWINKYKDDKP